MTRDAAARALGLARPVIDALISSGAVLCRVNEEGEEAIPPEQFEALFRDSLLRLYHAQATTAAAEPQLRLVEPREETIEIPAAAPEPAAEEAPVAVAATTEIAAEPVVIQTAAEVEEPSRESDHRLAPRYVPRKQLGGTFNGVKYTILQISNTGLRIRHEEPLLAGDEGRLTFTILGTRTFLVRARVVWTSIARDASFCISGIRVIEHGDRMRQAVELLRAARELAPEKRTTRRRNADVQPPVLAGLTDDQVASIIRAVRKFGSDPIEAGRWYARARFSLADEAVRRAAPQQARDREEVVGIWEYLERRIDLSTIAGVVSWLRKSRATTFENA